MLMNRAVIRGTSKNPVKTLEEIQAPYKIIFPETIEGSVNTKMFKFEKGKQVILTYPEYEAIAHSSYARYLGH